MFLFAYSYFFYDKHDTMGILHSIILDKDEKSGYITACLGKDSLE